MHPTSSDDKFLIFLISSLLIASSKFMKWFSSWWKFCGEFNKADVTFKSSLAVAKLLEYSFLGFNLIPADTACKAK